MGAGYYAAHDTRRRPTDEAEAKRETSVLCLLGMREHSMKEIAEAAGLSGSEARHIIDRMSAVYPIYQDGRKYGLL
jgi:DNA-binding IclR family transcriptional regulator